MTSNDNFFQRQQAAAVLKHGILGRYPTVFATMTGRNSQGNRVVYLDGYAGPGRYDDAQRSPGSPLLAVDTAKRVANWARDVECHFVEKDPAYSVRHRAVVLRVVGHAAGSPARHAHRGPAEPQLGGGVAHRRDPHAHRHSRRVHCRRRNVGAGRFFSRWRLVARAVELARQEAEQIEAALEHRWVEEIANNLAALVASHPVARLGDHTAEVYGATLGLARDAYVRKAWDALAARGVVAGRQKSEKYLDRGLIARA